MNLLIAKLKKINCETKILIEYAIKQNIDDATYEKLFEIFQQHNLALQKSTKEYLSWEKDKGIK